MKMIVEWKIRVSFNPSSVISHFQSNHACIITTKDIMLINRSSKASLSNNVYLIYDIHLFMTESIFATYKLFTHHTANNNNNNNNNDNNSSNNNNNLNGNNGNKTPIRTNLFNLLLIKLIKLV